MPLHDLPLKEKGITTIDDVYTFLNTEKTIILCPHCNGKGNCGCYSCSGTWHWISSICFMCRGMKAIRLVLPERTLSTVEITEEMEREKDGTKQPD